MKTKQCPRCGKDIFKIAGLFRCETCGPIDQHRFERPFDPLPPREIYEWEDDTRTPAIDGKPIPIDRQR